MPTFNGLDFFNLSDVIYNLNNPGVCKNILFSISTADFSTKIASKMMQTSPLSFLALLVTEMLLMYKRQRYPQMMIFASDRFGYSVIPSLPSSGTFEAILLIEVLHEIHML